MNITAKLRLALFIAAASDDQLGLAHKSIQLYNK